jgi:hypothetical protein
MKPKAEQAPVVQRWWSPPFSESPDPVVRRAFAEFVTCRAGRPYSVGDAVAYLERRVPQRAGSSNSGDPHAGQLGIGLTRWLRELRA